MKNKFYLEIVGDTNDGDYATATTLFSLDELIEFPTLKAPDGSRFDREPMKVIDFFTMFGLALKDPRKHRHVLSRQEWDDSKATTETIKLFAKRAYGIDDIEETLSDDKTDEAFTDAVSEIEEILSEYLPWNVHSIESISFYPAFSKQVIFK